VANNTVRSTQQDNIVCDLEFRRLQEELLSLSLKELEQLEQAVNKVSRMTWQQLYAMSSKTNKRGLNWEPISGQATANGKTIASIRINAKFRARVCRDEQFMRFISLHTDHDSAYDEKGGEHI
jgi:hypothetical protein